MTPDERHDLDELFRAEAEQARPPAGVGGGEPPSDSPQTNLAARIAGLNPSAKATLNEIVDGLEQMAKPAPKPSIPFTNQELFDRVAALTGRKQSELVDHLIRLENDEPEVPKSRSDRPVMTLDMEMAFAIAGKLASEDMLNLDFNEHGPWGELYVDTIKQISEVLTRYFRRPTFHLDVSDYHREMAGRS